MGRGLVLMGLVGFTALAVALAVPSIAHSVFGPSVHGEVAAGGSAACGDHCGWAVGPGMMGGMMGGMHGEGWAAGEGSREGYGGNVTVAGTVVDKHHMVLEVEARGGGEVEVMLHRWWKVTLPNGETVEMPGWELAENYIRRGETIVVQGYGFEGHGHCMGGEEGETHLAAHHIELPEQGITATLG